MLNNSNARNKGLICVQNNERKVGLMYSKIDTHLLTGPSHSLGQAHTECGRIEQVLNALLLNPGQLCNRST